MDQMDAGTATGLLNEIHLFSEAQLGFRKPKIMSDQHVILSTEDVLPHQYADTTAWCDKVEEPVVATKEIELQSIRNLLPDEDDLFSGIIDELRCSSHSDGSEEEEDFDLCRSGGGMEFEVDNCLNPCQENSNNTNGISNGGRSSNVSIASKHPYGEHPSRTLFVRNINSYLEDSELRSLFERYGDIQTVYSACKHRGFVIISYYDIRAAWSAMKSLQNKPVRSRNLDIHYTIPKDNLPEKDINLGTLVVFNHDSLVSNDELRQIFGSFGEIKEIGKTLQYQRFIEFYDIRAAEAAYCALNRKNIAGKQIKLELSHPGGERQCSMQEFSPVLVQDEHSRCGSLTDTSSSEQIANVPPAPLTTSCIYGGSVCGLHTKSEMDGSGFNENAFSQGSFSVPNSFPVRVATICNQFGLRESKHSLDQGKSGNQCTPNYHLHSLPENYDGSTNEVPYDPFSTVANLAIDVGPRILEGTNDRHIYITDPCQQVERYDGVFGTSWTSGFPIHGNHYVGRHSNSFQHLPASPLVWRNSSPFVNGIHAHCTPKQPGLSRSSAHVLTTVLHTHDMLNTVSHTQQCHNGSAPATNLTCWNSEHAYMAESSEVGFHMESFGRVGFHRRSSTLASHTFLHEDHIDTFLNSALSCPQRMCQNFSRVNLVASAPTSSCTKKKRMKNLSNCRSEADSCHAEKIMYELDIDRVLRREDSRTTLMIKNIPNKYTSKMLLTTIDEQHWGTYDFIYLPIDFKNKCNMGYAFINMIYPLQIVPFYKTFNGKKWEKFNSGKVASLAYARIQGKAALVGHFQSSSLMNEDKRYRPILFCTDGPNAGDQEPFPPGPSIRSRSSKRRSSFNEEYHNQASPSSFVRRELISSGTNSLSGSMKDSNFEQTTNQMHLLL